MTTRDDFIAQEIIPTLGVFADSFDLDAICDEVCDFDEREGYVWKPKYREDGNGASCEAYWNVVKRHDMGTDL